ncbi:hypothetical protein [Rhodococcus sp. ACS1]|uniref:hypothetical protein n=1 Tax=Rhodococcus sp. ACS1 TaxID=2028570 RepID=UPI00117B36C7|nr:hypothetical protein [Rhodococcus sp. ACS1]
MKIVSAILTGQATIPTGSGIANLLDAGISWIERASYPAELGLKLILFVEPESAELGRQATLDIAVRAYNDETDPILSVTGTFDAELNPTHVGEDTFGVLIPVGIDLASVPIPQEGRYIVELGFDGQPESVVKFRARLFDTSNSTTATKGD